MKNFVTGIALVLFAVAFSTRTNAQTFQVDNNTSFFYSVSYCAMNTGSIAPGGSYSATSTCTSSLPCFFVISFPAAACPSVIVPLSPCPMLGLDYTYSTVVLTGCPAQPRVRITFYYDGGTNDILITLG